MKVTVLEIKGETYETIGDKLTMLYKGKRKHSNELLTNSNQWNTNSLVQDFEGWLRGVMVKEINCGILVSEFELQSRY